MKPMPLKWRISILACLVLAAVVVIISAVAYHELEESLIHNLDRSLKQMARAIGVEVEEGRPPETMQRDIHLMLNGTDRSGAVHYRVWLDGGDADLLASDELASTAGQALRDLPRSRGADRPHHLFTLDIQGRQHRATWLRRDIAGKSYNILVAQRIDYAQHEMREFLRMLVVLGGLVVAGSFAVATLLILWGMRPLTRAAATLCDISHPAAGGRALQEASLPAELDLFKNAVVQLLERTDELLRRQQEFTADASHELRTPLALAKSTLQAVRMRDRDDAAYRQAIDDALGDLSRMESLIEQLLALARLDSASDAQLPAMVDLRSLLAEVAAEFDQSPVNVVNPGPLPVTVRGSAEQLARLFRNLVDNAIRHGPPGGPVTIAAELASDGLCAVTVHDAGGQVSQAEIDKLFDRFYRTDVSRARATGGTGLGLPIARAIAARHGGRIEITSSPEAGTEVRIFLPTVSGDDAQQ